MMASRRSADVVVIGGGIVGVCAAYYLAREGLDVVLVERDGIACGTSGCCMGHLMVVAGPEPMYRLTRASVRAWGELAETLGTFSIDRTGTLWLADREDDLPLLDELQAKLAGYGDDGRVLDAAALREREPGLAPDLPGAFFYPHDGVVMPTLAAGAIARAARAHGADLRTGVTVLGLRRDGGGAVAAVRTDGGEIPTRHVVCAAGVWSPALAESAGLACVPVHPRRGDLAITTPRAAPIRHQLLEVGYLRTTRSAAADPGSGAADPGAQALNVQPQTHGTCLIGSTRQFAGFERTVNRELLGRSLRRAARFVPALAGAGITRTWAGLRPWTADQRPILGPVDEVPGFWFATGHEGLGITLAPISGAVVADGVLGRPPRVEPEPFLWARFGATVHG